MEYRTKAELKQGIDDKKRKIAQSQQALIIHFHETKEALKPSNLIKSTFNNVTGNSKIGGTLLKAGLSVGAALLTKRFVGKASGTLASKALGLAMNLGLVGAIAAPLKNKGLSLLKKLVNRDNGKLKAFNGKVKA